MPSDDGRLGFSRLVRYAPDRADILIVEDEPDVRESLSRLVGSFGYQVRGAASAEEADSWLVAQRFHVCLLDIELPRMKGSEFLEWALGRDPEMAVIMLTGIDDPDLALRCIENGARTYLVKPVDAEFLRAALRDALAVRRLLVERNRTSAEAATD